MAWSVRADNFDLVKDNDVILAPLAWQASNERKKIIKKIWYNAMVVNSEIIERNSKEKK